MKASKVAQANPVLKKTRSIKDCATGNWSEEFEIVQVDGRKSCVVVPRDDAKSTQALIRHLNQKGAQLPREDAARARLLESVMRAKPEKVVYQLANPGWQIRGSESPWFCCGRRLVGAPTGAREYSPPSFIEQSRAKGFAARGTLEAWRVRVAEKAMLSTSLTVIIAAALAAPLLHPSGLQNFTLHLSGPTRAGKTTSLIAAMSVYGFGIELDLPNWNASGLRLLEAAAAFRDIPFPLNEVGAKKGRRAQTYHDLRDLYAQYAEGSDRERHSTWSADHGGVARRLRGICISTAEHSIAQYATMAGEVRDGGELFRAIDVNAIRKGKATIFDLAPQDLDQRAALQELRKATAECHGTALMPYIGYLMRMGPTKVKTRTRALIQEFVEHMPEAAHDGVIGQMATHFGLLYAGSNFGVEFGVLPCTKDHLQRAITRGFEDAVKSSKTVDPLVMGLDILRANLSDKIVERKPGSTFGVNDHAGYWTRIGGKRIFVVHTRQFRAWFASVGQCNLVLNSLATKGLMKRTSTSSRGVMSAEDMKGVLRRWPDKSLVRSFEFSDPFPETNPTAARKGLHRFKARKKILSPRATVASRIKNRRPKA